MPLEYQSLLYRVGEKRHGKVNCASKGKHLRKNEKQTLQERCCVL